MRQISVFTVTTVLNLSIQVESNVSTFFQLFCMHFFFMTDHRLSQNSSWQFQILQCARISFQFEFASSLETLFSHTTGFFFLPFPFFPPFSFSMFFTHESFLHDCEIIRVPFVLVVRGELQYSDDLLDLFGHFTHDVVPVVRGFHQALPTCNQNLLKFRRGFRKLVGGGSFGNRTYFGIMAFRPPLCDPYLFCIPLLPSMFFY